jgi:Xaa-Pro aminopeptidase
MEKSVFAIRRQKLLAQLGNKDAVILFGSSELLRNGDVHFPFRQNSNFFYYTGYSEPEAIAVLIPGDKGGEYIIFNTPKDPVMERWVGTRVGQEGAVAQFGADTAFDIYSIDEKILELLAGREQIFYDLGSHPLWDKRILDWTHELQKRARRSHPCPAALGDLKVKSNEMRLFKDQIEIAILREAAQKSAEAHRAAMQKCKSGMFEFQLEAVVNYELMVRGCRFSAYPAIVGGGPNACILHYNDNSKLLKDGDLVLIDAGGEYENYASDITRTFPVNGKFSKEQAEIYNLVLEAQLKVIDLIRPGTPLNLLQDAAVNVLAKGLIRLGILSGTISDVIQQKSYQDYYMHNVSHWLGLDVHDAGSYRINDEWRTLEEGMVLTVEPGLYLSSSNELNKKWWDIGIRIEDDVLVTASGCEVLSHDAPKTIAEIERIMGEAS